MKKCKLCDCEFDGPGEFCQAYCEMKQRGLETNQAEG